MSKGYSFDLNGLKFTVQENVNISKWKGTPAKKILSIFDENKDGILSKDELDKITANLQEVTVKKTATTGKKEPQVKPKIFENLPRGLVENIEKGNIIKKTFDTDGDGKPDYIKTSEYDEKGNLIKITEDTNGDGKPEELYMTKFDEKGNLIKRTEYRNRDDKTSINITEYNYDTVSGQ